jgi:hypothetical protein
MPWLVQRRPCTCQFRKTAQIDHSTGNFPRPRSKPALFELQEITDSPEGLTSAAAAPEP